MTVRSRYDLVDVLRGTAIAMMFIYHFCFDLDYFGFAEFDFNHHPFWLNFRSLIVSLFLFIVGISLFLATCKKLNLLAYFRRLALLLVYSVLISFVSYLLFPNSMIFFGILHFIALACVLGLLFTPLYWGNLIIGIVLIVTGLAVEHPIMNQPALQWIGLMTHKPITEDYVPLLPWFGVVLLGLFVAKFVFNHLLLKQITDWQSTHKLSNILAIGGRHSLHIYMLHQPVFMGILYPLFLLN